MIETFAQCHRFIKKIRVNEETGCWEWTAAANRHGYGALVLAGKNYEAHRVAYDLFVGPIPSGMRVCHKCDNPPCVCPAHLFLGTQADNLRDGINKGRIRGLTDEQFIDVRRRYHEGGESSRSIASRYGVREVAIAKIVRGGTAPHLPGAAPCRRRCRVGIRTRAPLSADEVREIMVLLESMSQDKIAKKFGVTQTTVSRIKLGRIHVKASGVSP